MDIVKIGYWSNSQNGLVVWPSGLSGCLMSGGSGHDANITWICETYEYTL